MLTAKSQSFLVITYLITAVVPPLLMTVLRPLTAGMTNYMPAGPTGVIFAALCQYHGMVPTQYRYRVATLSSGGVTLSDKSSRYAMAVHLSLLQWPGSVVAAAVGWVVGHAWREGLMPAALVKWRVPGWLLGTRGHRHRGEFEGLRRRLEGEGGGAGGAAGASTGVQGQEAGGERRRTMGQQIMAQIRDTL